jgi:hypothetical protein
MSKSLVTWAIVLWLGAIAPTVAVADQSGLAHGRPGAKCQTEQGAFATLTLRDRQRVSSISMSGDEKAFQQLFDQGIAIELRQLTVFVEARHEIYAQIRPEGQLELLWVGAFHLKCPKEKKAAR